MRTTPTDIPAYMKRFFAQYLPNQRLCSPDTIASYRDGLRLYLLYIRDKKHTEPSKVCLEHLSVENVLDFLDDAETTRGNGPRTRNARLTAIRAFVRYLLMMEPLWTTDLHPIMAIPQKRADRRLLTFLTTEEVDTLLDAPDLDTWSGIRDRVLLTVMYNTGARHGQAMTRSGVEKRLRIAVRIASEFRPSLRAKHVSPHTLRHYGERSKMVREDSKLAKPADYSSILSPFYH